VKINKPLDREPRRQFVTVNNDTPGYAHQQNVDGDPGPDSECEKRVCAATDSVDVAAIVAKPPPVLSL
jgi:hypothetical protein